MDSASGKGAVGPATPHDTARIPGRGTPEPLSNGHPPQEIRQQARQLERGLAATLVWIMVLTTVIWRQGSGPHLEPTATSLPFPDWKPVLVVEVSPAVVMEEVVHVLLHTPGMRWATRRLPETVPLCTPAPQVGDMGDPNVLTLLVLPPQCAQHAGADHKAYIMVDNTRSALIFWGAGAADTLRSWAQLHTGQVG